ncbi:MAG: hypothetical protein HKL90_00895 [Elusimicrobia bacterium]|nr:hypothetical protein [Elusimicrobiota bacterium]
MTIKSEAADCDARILKSMRQWELIDAKGRELGRGLGRRQMVERVALETGTSARRVLSVLKLDAKM